MSFIIFVLLLRINVVQILQQVSNIFVFCRWYGTILFESDNVSIFLFCAKYLEWLSIEDTAVSISPSTYSITYRKICRIETDPPWVISISDMTCNRNKRFREFSPITCTFKRRRNIPETLTVGINWDRISLPSAVVDGTRVVNVILSFALNISSMTLFFQDSAAGFVFAEVCMSVVWDGIWLHVRNVVWWGRGLLSSSVSPPIPFFSDPCLLDKPTHFYRLQPPFLARLTPLLISWTSPPVQRGASITCFRVMLPPSS